MSTAPRTLFGLPSSLLEAYLRGLFYVAAHVVVLTAVVVGETVLSDRLDHGLLYAALTSGLYLGIRSLAPRALGALARSTREQPVTPERALDVESIPLRGASLGPWPLRLAVRVPGVGALLAPRAMIAQDGLVLESRLGPRVIAYGDIALAMGNGSGIHLVLRDGRRLDLVTGSLPGRLLALVYAPLARVLLAAELARLIRNEAAAERIARAAASRSARDEPVRDNPFRELVTSASPDFAARAR